MFVDAEASARRHEAKLLRISVRFKDDVAIMSLSGKFLAGSDGPFLRQKVKDLTDAGTKKLILDFGGVPYIDSTGLGFLVGSLKTVEEARARLVLSSLNEHVKRILEGLRLSQFFLIAEDEAKALTQLNQEAKPAARPPKPAPPKAKKRPPRKAPQDVED